jgi:hypothetical protein
MRAVQHTWASAGRPRWTERNSAAAGQASVLTACRIEPVEQPPAGRARGHRQPRPSLHGALLAAGGPGADDGWPRYAVGQVRGVPGTGAPRRRRVVPSLGHLALRMITYGAVDRAVHSWIADECGKSTVKNSIAVLVRVIEQPVRDGILERNPARITGWQREYQRAEDELDDPARCASRLDGLADTG